MKIVKVGKSLRHEVFHGTCPHCESEMEEERSALRVERCPREHYEFAHATCPVCDMGFVMVPEGSIKAAVPAGHDLPKGDPPVVAVPKDWYTYHLDECGTRSRGCSTDCPQYIYESTGKWVGERMMRERLAMLEEDASELRACLGMPERHCPAGTGDEQEDTGDKVERIPAMSEIRAFVRPILGQEAICPDGLGRVVAFCEEFPHRWIQVSTYVSDRGCKWDPDNVELLDPR